MVSFLSYRIKVGKNAKKKRVKGSLVKLEIIVPYFSEREVMAGEKLPLFFRPKEHANTI